MWRNIILTLASAGCFTAAQAADAPNPLNCSSCFIGTLHLSPNPKDAGTKILEEDLLFVDFNKIVWKAGKGDVTDGASIPELFQPIIGVTVELR
jgi:hypothetical protein